MKALQVKVTISTSAESCLSQPLLEGSSVEVSVPSFKVSLSFPSVQVLELATAVLVSELIQGSVDF